MGRKSTSTSCWELEVGDGGLTYWTAQLMGSAQEVCMTSCLPQQRLAT